DDDGVAGQQAVVAVLVGDDLDLGGHLGVALDQSAHGRGQAGGETPGGQQGDTTNRHGRTFQRGRFGVPHSRGTGPGPQSPISPGCWPRASCCISRFTAPESRSTYSWPVSSAILAMMVSVTSRRASRSSWRAAYSGK